MSSAAATTTSGGTKTKAQAQSAARKGGDPTRRGGWGARIALVLVVLIWSVPTVGLLVTSLRTRDEANSTGWWTALANPFGSEWTLSNFDAVLRGNGMGTAFINSFIVSVPATIIPIMFAAFAAYAFTFMQFRGRDFLLIIVIALLVVPNQIAFVPMLEFFGSRGLDVIGQFLPMWLLHTGFGMPLAIYILRSYMSTLPRTVIESADIDGASHFQTFWRLIVPMSVPALAAFAIFQFLWVWNDLLIALLFLGFGNEVVTVNLSQLLGRLGEGWQLLTAGAFVTMTVPLIVFFSLQRYFVRGLTAGSVKG